MVLRVKEEAAAQAGWETMFDAVPVGLCLLDTDLHVVWVNDWFVARFFDPMHQHEGPISSLVQTELWELIGSNAGAGAAEEVGFEYQHESGRTYLMKITPTTATDSSGSLALTVVDITGEIVELVDRYTREKMNALGVLTGGIAHDFNNQLAVILGRATLIATNPDLPESARIGLEAIIETTQRGGSVAERLMAFSRQDSPEPVVLDVNDAVNSVVEAVRDTLSRSMTIVLTPSESTHHAYADPAQLQASLLNILLNAEEASPDHARIDVSIDCGPHPQSAASEIRISVRDHGSGIEPALISRVLEPFFTTKGDLGSGLGLSMVHSSMAAIGGRIELESNSDGVGTTATLVLRAAERAPAALHTEICIEGPEQLKILVVEDHPPLLALVAQTCDRLGDVIGSASDASEALSILYLADHVDLLVTDVMLPGGYTGVTLAAEAKRYFPDIAIVLTSGYAEFPVKIELEDFTLVPKPFAYQELEAGVREALASARKAAKQRRR